MEIIDGKKVAEEILAGLKERVERLPFKPVFIDVMVQTDTVTNSYVNAKKRAAERIGIEVRIVTPEKDFDTQKLVQLVKNESNTKNLTGLIVQLPLPKEINTVEVLNAISSELDVDCVSTERENKFIAGDLSLEPPTAAAVMNLLDSLKLDLSKLKISIIGKGKLVGKPVSIYLKHRNLDFRVIDRSTVNSDELIKESDVIISAAGSPLLIKGGMVKPGVVIIDAGTAEDGGSVKGDVDLESVESLASYVSPVPGGVGPVTIAKLLENVVRVAEKQ